MSDCCQLHVTFRASDFLKGPSEYFGVLAASTQIGVVKCFADEANYALMSERDLWCGCGVMFMGHHTSGGEYGPHWFVCDGVKHFEILTTGVGYADDKMLVELSKHGVVVESSMTNVRAFLKMRERVAATLKELESGTENASNTTRSEH